MSDVSFSKSFSLLKKLSVFTTWLLSFLFLFSCKTLPQTEQTEQTVQIPQSTPLQPQDQTMQIPEEITTNTKQISRKLADKGMLTATQLAEFFLSQRPDYDLIEITHFAQYYVVEASVEGINSDVAFAQMCLETGYLRFGGLVQPDFHNYCGLGAMDAEHPGCIFESEQLGVRAHIQHLQAYATTEETTLINELIDPRYSWVHKTKYIKDIFGLTGTWATDPQYGNKIESILCKMENLFF